MTKADPQLYALIQSDCAFAHLEMRTLIEVRGADRTTFLHNLCTNDIRNLDVGHGCETYFTNVQGKTLLHALLFCEPESIVIESSPGHAATVLPHMDKYLITEDVTLTNQTGYWTEFWVAGAKADQTLSSLGMEIPNEMLSHVSVEVAGTSAQLRRVPFAVLPCFILQIQAKDAGAVVEQFRRAAIAQVEHSVVEALRIEAGFPSYGQDITIDNLPQEISRDKLAISFTKGCYLGQETVARIDALGHVNRHLVHLVFDDAIDVPSEGTEIHSEDKVVGHVTSACWSPHNDRVIGLGFVRRTIIEANSELSSPAGKVRIGSPSLG